MMQPSFHAPARAVPDISIIIPAHNAEGCLRRALDSLSAQSFDPKRMQVIVVDDGSTDGTAAIIASYQATAPFPLEVISLPEPSGSPALPRNRGIECATGEYVFFLDADDWLGDQAVSRMLAHAGEWGSDVLLVKLKGENGRSTASVMFGRNRARVDAYRSLVTCTLGPWKLYRRSIIASLRFPKDMPEDIEFVLRAYDAADVISIAADYDYYHLAFTDDGGNASFTMWDHPASNIRSYRRIFDFIGSSLPARARRSVLMRRLFKIEVCRTFIGIVHYGGDDAPDLYDEFAQMTRPFYSPIVKAMLPAPHRALLRSALGAKGSYGFLAEYVRGESFDRSNFFEC